MNGQPLGPAEELAPRLSLVPHPEGGFYRETSAVRPVDLPDGRRRSASTAILYLLPPGTCSTWHRVASDEIWHHYDGGALRLHLLGGGSLGSTVRRRRPWCPPAMAGGGPDDDAVLCGCTVSPGFDFADFELGRAGALLRLAAIEAVPHGRRLRRCARPGRRAVRRAVRRGADPARTPARGSVIWLTVEDDRARNDQPQLTEVEGRGGGEPLHFAPASAASSPCSASRSKVGTRWRSRFGSPAGPGRSTLFCAVRTPALPQRAAHGAARAWCSTTT